MCCRTPTPSRAHTPFPSVHSPELSPGFPQGASLYLTLPAPGCQIRTRQFAFSLGPPSPVTSQTACDACGYDAVRHEPLLYRDPPPLSNPAPRPRQLTGLLPGQRHPRGAGSLCVLCLMCGLLHLEATINVTCSRPPCQARHPAFLPIPNSRRPPAQQAQAGTLPPSTHPVKSTTHRWCLFPLPSPERVPERNSRHVQQNSSALQSCLNARWLACLPSIFFSQWVVSSAGLPGHS